MNSIMALIGYFLMLIVGMLSVISLNATKLILGKLIVSMLNAIILSANCY